MGDRIVLLGRGGSGKSTLARRLASITGIDVIELDSVFWQADLSPHPDWAAAQRDLLAADRWIIDGDLGPYDSHLADRLAAADTVVILDPPLTTCIRRVLGRGRERLDFWRWMLPWRRRSLPGLLAAIDRHAPDATLLRLRTDDEVAAFLRDQSRI